MVAIFIHVNTKDHAEAKDIAEFLLAANLISCANIMPQHHAIYEWEGKFVSEPETSMILKTEEKNYKEIERVLLLKHSYDCPPICYWKVDGGYKPYLAWIKNRTV